MIYADSSALLKLLHEEAESSALTAWLTERTKTPVVSSVLARIEVLRATRRINARALPTARTLLGGIDLIPLTSDVVDTAAELEGSVLRSLDAIHLASAFSIRSDLSAFLAYNHRLIDAATAAGVECISPGA